MSGESSQDDERTDLVAEGSEILDLRHMNIVEFADRWFKTVEQDFYPCFGRRTVFYAMPQAARHDFHTWWLIFTELIDLFGPDATPTDLSPDAIDRWIESKMKRRVEKGLILHHVRWLTLIFDHAVRWGYLPSNRLRSAPPSIPDDYVGFDSENISNHIWYENPIEEARDFKRLMRLHRLSGREFAWRRAISQSKVVKALALLDLPDWLQKHVEERRIHPSTAIQITKHPDHNIQVEIAESVLRDQLTRSDVIDQIRNLSADGTLPAKTAKAKRGCPIELQGHGMPVIVMGIERPAVSKGAYHLLLVLTEAYPRHVGLKTLLKPRRDGGVGTSARYHLKALSENLETPWFRSVIHFGGPWIGYALAWPES
jgi:hypothetical protein